MSSDEEVELLTDERSSKGHRNVNLMIILRA